MPKLNHKDSVVLVLVTSSEYGNKKDVIEQHDIKGTFIQDVGFLHSNNQDVINSNGVLFPDETNPIVIANHNRLEGMYIVAPLFGGDPASSWYKITSVTVNRAHLLSNKIDNIQCLLKKTEALPGVS